jgi:hypothetical protein
VGELDDAMGICGLAMLSLVPKGSRLGDAYVVALLAELVGTSCVLECHTCRILMMSYFETDELYDQSLKRSKR